MFSIQVFPKSKTALMPTEMILKTSKMCRMIGVFADLLNRKTYFRAALLVK